MVFYNQGRPSWVSLPGQQVLHSLGEALVVEVLEEGNGIPAHALGVAEPGAAVLNPQAVHLRCGVVTADGPDLIAKRCEQVRQVRVPGGLQLRL